MRLFRGRSPTVREGIVRNVALAEDGHRVRGVVRSMKTTQALTTPSVKVERADGEIVKIPFNAIVEIINHNRSGRAA